jgi:hypothetical protein
MKSSRKAKAVRRPLSRRARPLTLPQRVTRLEAQVFPKVPAAVANIVADARFTNLDANGKPTSGDHVAVRDNTTGLEWSAGIIGEANWADAKKLVADCKLLGKTDWRLPTVKELAGLIDYDRYDPAVDPAHFKGEFGWTWSGTPYKGDSGYAWLVFLHYGSVYWLLQSIRGRVRAVRAGQQLASRNKGLP